jgi:hypothetical protein
MAPGWPVEGFRVQRISVTLEQYLLGEETWLPAASRSSTTMSDVAVSPRFSRRQRVHHKQRRLSPFLRRFSHALQADTDLRDNWDIVKEWNESSRYARKTKADATDLYEAITDNKHGVLSWLKPRW